jgi:hypothetical protein
MNSEHQSGSPSVPDLTSLLHELGQAPLAAREGEEDGQREARFAARIDGQLERLARERQRSRIAWAVFALAAAVPLAYLAQHVRERPASGPSIAREPTTSSRAAPLTEPKKPPIDQRPAAPLINPRKAPSAVVALPPSSAGVEPASSSSVASAALSTLAEENRLFTTAVQEARAGNVDLALTGFEQLLSAHPQSPLAQTALVRKFRLLASTGRGGEARAEAERYLRLYPTGFAEREARATAHGDAPEGGPSLDDSNSR